MKHDPFGLPEELVNELRKIVGVEDVLLDEDDLLCYSRDRLPILANREYIKRADAVARPESSQEIAEIIKFANKHLIPVIPRGGGTNFAGGIVPKKGGIILDMMKMDEILEIDKDSLSVRVQAGVILESLEHELNKYGLTLGHDPGSFPCATIGGAVATDAVGCRANRYGVIRDMVLGMELVLPTGGILRTITAPKSASGLNLNHLFIGSEGTLGVITELTVKVRPLPQARVIIAFEFQDFEKGLKASGKIAALGLIPAAQILNDEVRSEGYSRITGRKLKTTLILCFEGTHEEVTVQKNLASKICTEAGGVTLPDEVGESWWEGRHAGYPAANREKTYDVIDISLPFSKVLKAYNVFSDILRKHGLENMGMGMFTMHPSTFSVDLYFNEERKDDIMKYLTVAAELKKAAIDIGGTMTHCIGVGTRSDSLMEYEHGVGLKIMKIIKKALDPNNIMNPGKIGLD